MITLRKTITGFLLIQVQIFLKASSPKCWSYYGYKPILSYPILPYPILLTWQFPNFSIFHISTVETLFNDIHLYGTFLLAIQSPLQSVNT